MSQRLYVCPKKQLLLSWNDGMQLRRRPPYHLVDISHSPQRSKKKSFTPSAQQRHYISPSDDLISRSGPRSSHTHADVSQTLNENRSSPSSSTSPITPTKISSQSSSHHYQEKKAPASIAKQHSRNQLSLSTSSFSPSSTAIDSRHSRSTSQSNTFTKVPSLVLPSIPPVGDQRALSKRNPGVTSDPSTVSSSQSLVVVAPPLSAPQKSSTFSRNLRPGTVIPSTNASTPEGSKPHPPKPAPAPAPKRLTGPKRKAHLLNPFSDLQLCPQCGNRLTMPLIQVNNSSFSSLFLLIQFLFFFFHVHFFVSLRSFGSRSHSILGLFLFLAPIAAFYSF